MDVRLLRYFLAVVEEGSFGGAARRAGVSQPAVSHGVRLLEEELGARLFDRDARSVVLTADGALLLDPARRLVAEFAALPDLLDRARGRVRGRLEIGTTDVASIYVLPRVYRTYRRRYPDVELSVRVEGTASLLRQLGEGSIELAVITFQAGERTVGSLGEGFVVEPLYREELEFFVSRRHRLAGRRHVTPKEMATVPLITFKRDSITRQAVDQAFRREGLTPRVAMEISSPQAIKKLVEVGLGAGVLPLKSLRADFREGPLVPVSVRGVKLSRLLGVARARRRTLTPAAEAFLELTERIRNVPGSARPPGRAG
jgi:DNA-binding transcriptional LysR family regulator